MKELLLHSALVINNTADTSEVVTNYQLPISVTGTLLVIAVIALIIVIDKVQPKPSTSNHAVADGETREDSSDATPVKQDYCCFAFEEEGEKQDLRVHVRGQTQQEIDHQCEGWLKQNESIFPGITHIICPDEPENGSQVERTASVLTANGLTHSRHGETF